MRIEAEVGPADYGYLALVAERRSLVERRPVAIEEAVRSCIQECRFHHLQRLKRARGLLNPRFAKLFAGWLRHPLRWEVTDVAAD